MRGLSLRVPLFLPLLLAAACTFHPDLTRFPKCGPGGACEAGATCLATENVCLPDCGEGQACAQPPGDAGAGDAGTPDGGADAGEVPTLLQLAGPTRLADARVGSDYEDTLMSTGGTPPYTYALAAGDTLPDGLQLEPTGRISGKPAAGASGTATFRVQVTDSATPPQVAEVRTVSLAIQPLSVVLSLAITTQALPEGRSGMPYDYTLRREGGSGPFEWVVWGLPDGLTLDSTSGRISGTPRAPTAPLITVQLQDGLGATDEQNFTLSVH